MDLFSRDVSRTNELASAWMHCGIDLLDENSCSAAERAVRCFDEAIALRSTLPLEDDHFFRYGLSAGWINRGDAFAKLAGLAKAEEAIASYEKALTLLETLPLHENILYPRRLAITWINRGIALQARNASSDLGEALECFREAIAVLELPSASALIDRNILLAGAWVNLAEALLGSSSSERDEACTIANKALELVRSPERTEIIAAEIGLKARHILCRWAVLELAENGGPSDVEASSTDMVDEAMELTRSWRLERKPGITHLLSGIFRFGCRLYAHGHPRHLAGFLNECLILNPVEWLGLDRESLDAAEAAMWIAVESIRPKTFEVSSSAFASFLNEIQSLRQIEERLKQLRAVITPAK